MDTVTLYRPVGQKELDLIAAVGFAAFPPRLSWQPIFYPVLTEDYVWVAPWWVLPETLLLIGVLLVLSAARWTSYRLVGAWLLLVFFAAATFFLHVTVHGRYFLAIGSNNLGAGQLRPTTQDSRVWRGVLMRRMF